jgi:tetraacyldisaccharide 4'-kinase
MSRPLLAPFVPLYAAAIGVKNLAYDRGWLQPKQLQWPAISVGNLSVGGSGKTPLVIRLAQLLAHQGLHVDVLSRGYGRNAKTIDRVDPEGSSAQFGDEPILIARTAGVPVYVAVNRYDAGIRAEREFASPGGIHLLDDGFQHRKLARAADIVVLHRTDFDEGLLPSGQLREPLSALHRASAIVLRAEDRQLESELRRRGVRCPLWIQHRRLVVAPTSRYVAFCGIARPDEFFSALRSARVEVAATLTYRDHHAYSDADIEQLIQRADNALAFVTTEKDAVRLSSQQRAKLASIAPLLVARLELSLEDEAAVTGQLMRWTMRK